MHVYMVKLTYGLLLQQIPPVGLFIESHFGNAGSLTYQHHPSKQRLPLLLGNDEKPDEPFFLSWFYTDVIHVPEVVNSGIKWFFAFFIK